MEEHPLDCTPWPHWFYFRIQRWFNMHNQCKGGNHMVISMDEGKILDKVQHPLQDKMTEETQKRRNVFGHNKKASHDNTVLNEEIWGAFPPKSITKQSVYSLYFPSILLRPR